MPVLIYGSHRQTWLASVLFAISLIAVGTIAPLTDVHAGELQKRYDHLYGSPSPVTREVHKPGDIFDDHSGIDEIGLERMVCFGTCPIYTVIIRKDGTFRYIGEEYVQHKGTFTGTVDMKDLRDLFKYINDMHYFQLATGYAYPVTDNPGTFTMVRRGKQEKLVMNYANSGPSELWAMEQLIDKLILEAKWDESAK